MKDGCMKIRLYESNGPKKYKCTNALTVVRKYCCMKANIWSQQQNCKDGCMKENLLSQQQNGNGLSTVVRKPKKDGPNSGMIPNLLSQQ